MAIGRRALLKKYYYDEHEAIYRKMSEGTIRAWDEYFDPAAYSYDHFMMRPFLEQALERIAVPGPSKTAFEYGCGTGAGASFLAQRGFKVDAVDLIPTAIAIAQKIALERKLDIRYEVADIIARTSLSSEYDLILDNYCLQSIVTDRDRQQLFALVRAGLKETGCYIIATAIYNESRSYGGDDCYFDPSTGIVYDKVSGDDLYEDALSLNGSCWIPNRRHITPDKLKEELTGAGFQVLFQENGNVICKKRE